MKKKHFFLLCKLCFELYSSEITFILFEKKFDSKQITINVNQNFILKKIPFDSKIKIIFLLKIISYKINSLFSKIQLYKFNYFSIKLKKYYKNIFIL